MMPTMRGRTFTTSFRRSRLETNPLIGRPARRSRRELIIGRPTRGYIALYRYVSEIDTVFILGLRSRREAGYKRV
jgi:toxin ParE1/3/4